MSLRRTAIVVSLAGLLALAGAGPATALPEGTKVETYKGGLSFPIDMAWVKGTKKVFFTEKSGAIRVMQGQTLLERPCVTLPVNDDGERGALGLALHPKFKSNHRLYVYYTNASPLENRVDRFVVRNNRCVKQKRIVPGMPVSASNHNGGHLEFVKGKLFVSTGENAIPSKAQDKQDRLGKILRYNSDGTVPRKSNPFGNAVWSYGHRNPFGLAHKPGTGRIYSSENGPSCDDELNLIKKGGNFGWGDGYDCGTAGVGSDPIAPIIRWESIIVPTDPGWYAGKMASLKGSLYMGDGDGRLHRFVMNDRGTKVKADRIIHNAGSLITDASTGPGGWLYFMTGSGIFRIVPN